jgi:hypothetical protein
MPRLVTFEHSILLGIGIGQPRQSKIWAVQPVEIQLKMLLFGSPPLQVYHLDELGQSGVGQLAAIDNSSYLYSGATKNTRKKSIKSWQRFGDSALGTASADQSARIFHDWLSVGFLGGNRKSESVDIMG